jgi:mono/diheme cytochrome c family protein
MRKPTLAISLVILAILLLSLALFAIACGSSTTATTAAVSTTAGVGTTAGVATTVAGGTTDAAALFAANCALSGCHKSAPGVGAAEAKAVIESGKGSMPSFTGKLTADQIQAIATYVGNGGK